MLFFTGCPVYRISVKSYNTRLIFIPYLETPMRLAQDQEALTFDDVLLVPARSEVMPKDVTLATQLTRGIDLKLSLIHI